MKLTIIIVSYNVKSYVEQSLRSVFRAIDTAAVEAEVYVVDNDSPDNTPGYLCKQFPKKDYPQLHILPNARNVGFGRANNQAARRAKGEYILFLNPDTIITEHTLKDMLAYADEHEDLGCMGVSMYSAKGIFGKESKRGIPTLWASFCKVFKLAALFPKSKFFGGYYLQHLPADKPCQTEMVSGACMLCRHDRLKVVGGFDEDFFMYGEDTDLSYRFLKAGFKNYYLPTPIIHYRGESAYKNMYRHVHIFYEGILMFFKKHFKRYSLLLTIPVHLLIYTLALGALIRNGLSNFSNFVRGNHSEREVTYVFVGSKTSKRHVEDIAERWSLRIQYVDSLMDAVSAPAECLIYDAAMFSYDEIIQHLINSSHKQLLGTYSHESKVLIACHQAFS